MQRFAFLSMLALGLAACAPSLQPQSGAPYSGDRPNAGLNGSVRNLIAQVQPSGAPDGSYARGEAVPVQIEVRQEGYLTVQRVEAGGNTHVLQRALPVKPGRLELQLPASAFPEPGLQRLRFSFYRELPVTVAGEVPGTPIEEISGPEAIKEAKVGRDVQETYFFIRR